MPPTGFEPATPDLEGQCSIQAELRGLIEIYQNNYLKGFILNFNNIQVFDCNRIPENLSGMLQNIFQISAVPLAYMS